MMTANWLPPPAPQFRPLRRAFTDPDDVLRVPRCGLPPPAMASRARLRLPLRALPRLSRVRSCSAPLTYSDPDRLADWGDWPGGDWDDDLDLPEGSVPPTSFTFRQRAAEKQRKRSTATLLEAEAVQSLGGQRIAGTRGSCRRLDEELPPPPPLPHTPEPEADYDDDHQDDFSRRAPAELPPATNSRTSTRVSHHRSEGGCLTLRHPRELGFRRQLSSDRQLDFRNRPSSVDAELDGDFRLRERPASAVLSGGSDREEDDDYAYAYDCIVSPAAVILSEMDDDDVPAGYSGCYAGAEQRENIYEELDELARRMRGDLGAGAAPAEAPPPPPGPRYSGDVHTEVQRVQRVHSQVMGELRLDMEAMLMPSQRWSDLDVPVGPTDDLLSPDSGFHSGSGSGSTVVSAAYYDTPNGPRTVAVPATMRPRLRKCESLDLKDALGKGKGKSPEKRLWKLTSVISTLLGKYQRQRGSKRRRPASPT